MISDSDRRVLGAQLATSRARLAEAKAELPKLARTSLAAYHQALSIVRDREAELDALELQIASPR